MIKRFFSIILILFAVISFAGCSQRIVEGNAQPIRSLEISDNDIALLSVFSDNGKGESTWLTRNYGHSFLAVTNISDSAFVVGDMTVEPNETITVGLWSVFEHFGVWYNIESNYIKEHNKYAERVSLTIGIGADDIVKMTDIIKNNDQWTPWYNCSKFALDIWNNVANTNEKIETKIFMSPGYLVDEIKEFSGLFENSKQCITSTNIRYYGEV